MMTRSRVVMSVRRAELSRGGAPRARSRNDAWGIDLVGSRASGPRSRCCFRVWRGGLCIEPRPEWKQHRARTQANANLRKILRSGPGWVAPTAAIRTIDGDPCPRVNLS